ncbi:MAG: FRG domain-containing protein [Smithella sp.]
MSSAIKQIQCSKAGKFLEVLNNRNPVWNKERRFWIFRGHNDNIYRLIPSALRSSAELGFTHKPKKGIQPSNSEQIEAEFERLQEFFWACDAQGLNVPVEGNMLRTPDSYKNLLDNIERQWPCDELLPLMALAQHYGINTRLLDWTENPLTAAHFAAISSIEFQQGVSKLSDKDMAVWALNLDWLIHDAFPASGKGKMTISIVTAPRASNPNLDAQGGVFTVELLDKKDQQKVGKTNARTVDEIVESRWQELNWQTPVMLHITLPGIEKNKLLRLLYKEGVDISSLFPGYQGVAYAIKERFYWDKQERPLCWTKR